MNDFNELGDGESVDDLVQTLSDALNADSDDKLVSDLVEKIIAKAGTANPIIGNFILVAEIINNEGEPQLMVSTSDMLPDWIARGMLAVADDFLMGFNYGDDHDGR